jgi:Protein of unknown function (DUF2934)
MWPMDEPSIVDVMSEGSFAAPSGKCLGTRGGGLLLNRRREEMMGRQEIDEEAIRRRAYELSREDGAGSADENWERAERELRRPSEDGPWAKTSSGDADSVTES